MGLKFGIMYKLLNWMLLPQHLEYGYIVKNKILLQKRYHSIINHAFFLEKSIFCSHNTSFSVISQLLEICRLLTAIRIFCFIRF